MAATNRTAEQMRVEAILGTQWDPSRYSYLDLTGTPISGVLDWSAQRTGAIFALKLNGAATVAPANMPATFLAGRAADFYVRYVQDATGGRTLTHDPAILPLGNQPQPTINMAPNAVTLIRYFYDGVAWFWESNRSAVPQKRTNAATASVAALDVNSNDIELAILTAQAAALTINAPSGNPVQGQMLQYRIKDNGTARALTWNAIFRAFGVALPTTTVINKTLYVTAQYNATDTKWDVTNVVQEV